MDTAVFLQELDGAAVPVTVDVAVDVVEFDSEQLEFLFEILDFEGGDYWDLHAGIERVMSQD